MDHGGEVVLPKDSAAFRILEDFVRRVKSSDTAPRTAFDRESVQDFFDGVVMLDDWRLLRKATLSLAGRLPSNQELDAISVANKRDSKSRDPRKRRREVFSTILDAVMKEEAFYDRLREGFNDIFLTLGVDGNPDPTVLSYEHFEKTRLWYQRYDLTHIEDEKERRQAGYKLANQ